ncbi:MAG: hypothetical protein K1X88_27865 [Nannocystaceae bacterium]|nr:hypothetical protein [Nannocystaceae bacterium]
MAESLQQLERTGAEVGGPPPALVVLPDPDARVAPSTRVLGESPIRRLVADAQRVGFDPILFAPGTTPCGPVAREIATGDRLPGAALVVFETTSVRAGLLELMVAHPLEDDERYTLYDAAGRPAASFVGHPGHVPAELPICEELPYPEGIGPRDVVRVVYREDLARAETLVLEAEEVFPAAPSAWRRWLGVPTLRWMAARRGPVAQLELVALVLVALALPLTLAGPGLQIPIAALCLLLGVHVSKLLKSVRVLRQHVDRDVGDVAGQRLARAARPLGHAAACGGLTYAVIAQSARADIAGLVLLAAGGAATMIALAQARFLLRGHEAPVFALPDAHAVAARLGLRLPSIMEGAPMFELVIVLAALPGGATAPWVVLLTGAAARVWRWFAGPLGAAGD